MTLEEAFKAKQLLYLEPFVGFKPCRGLTGKYYYDTTLDREDPKDLMVEIKLSFFKKKWVHLHRLKEIKTYIDT